MATISELTDQMMMIAQAHMSKAYDHAFHAGRAKTREDFHAHNKLMNDEHEKAMHAIAKLTSMPRDTPENQADLTRQRDML